MYRDFIFKKNDEETVYKSKEGKFIPLGGFQGQSVGLLTSGGDAQGMNAAIRSAVRMCIYCGATVYFVFDGLQGLIDGGLNIREAYWSDVSVMLNQGGTVIGSARCDGFRTRNGRLRAAKNLIDRGILNLVVIGGDGSLTGADIFRQEWTSLVDELIEKKIIDIMKKKFCKNLNIVGLVGSIDNDFCGTDMTIGVNSALTRILEAIDALVTTAHSHHRCFIIEVMGRNCGYLALVTAISCEAQYVFIPEKPPIVDWEVELCNKLEKYKDSKRRINLVIVSEGAVDSFNVPISTKYIQTLITDKLNIDTRITVLGHVQRGGAPSAFDRILGARQGIESINALIDAHNDPQLPACVICINGNVICRKPLVDCVRQSKNIHDLIKKGEFEDLVNLRGSSFFRNYKIYETLNNPTQKSLKFIEEVEDRMHNYLKSRPLDHSISEARIGMLCVGTAACGMNAAIRSVVRMAIKNDLYPIGIKFGFEGFVNEDYTSLFWNDVHGILSKGGTILGTRRLTPEQAGYETISNKMRMLGLSALVIIGGYEGFLSTCQFYRNRDQFDIFKIPIAYIPATIDNNIPGIQFSIGNDTALNVMMNCMDNLKMGSMGTRFRIYIVETMGRDCGYLNTMAAISGGADVSYIDEEPLTIEVLNHDVNRIKAKLLDEGDYGIVLRSNISDHPYNSEYIFKLFKQEGSEIFDCRHNSIGHILLGGNASAFDRNLGTKSGVQAVLWVKQMLDEGVHSTNNIIIIGLSDTGSAGFTPIQLTFDNIDYEKRRPKRLWWMSLRPLMRILHTHESQYDNDFMMKNFAI